MPLTALTEAGPEGPEPTPLLPPSPPQEGHPSPLYTPPRPGQGTPASGPSASLLPGLSWPARAHLPCLAGRVGWALSAVEGQQPKLVPCFRNARLQEQDCTVENKGRRAFNQRRVGVVTLINKKVDFKIIASALADVAQWTECQPVNQRVVGSIPSQGTCQGCKPRPQSGAHKRQPHIDISLLLFLPSFFSV